MNPKQKLLVDALENNGFSLNPYGIIAPKREQCMLFSHDDTNYLVSFHDNPVYKPNQDAFQRELIIAKNSGLNPLPIFDDAIFFRKDPGRREYRQTTGDLRNLFGLELITLRLFGEVTYVSDSGIFVVSYGQACADYRTAIDESKVRNLEQVQIKGIIPRAKRNPILKTRWTVRSNITYPTFELYSLDSLGKIRAPNFRFSIRIPDSRADPIRGRQILDTTDSDSGCLTWQDLKDIEAAKNLGENI